MPVRSPSPLPSAATVGAVATTLAVLFAGGVIWFTRILPAINDQPVQVSSTVLADPVPAADADRWSGVAQLTGAATCTGVLIDTGSQTGPGYLLTAGHCGPARDADPNAVITNQPAEVTATFRPIAGVEPVAVGVSRVMYSSMKGTDVSVLRLDATLGELRDRGLRAYPIVATDPGSGAPVTNVAVPADGVDDPVLRAGSCRLGPTADLVEAGWLFDAMSSNDCPGVRGGSSGSPLFNGSDEIAGLLTTTTAGSLPGGECALDTPCERTATGVRVVADTSYGVPAAGLDRCFANGTFGLSQACPLPRQSLTFLPFSQTVFRPEALAEQGGEVSALVRAGAATTVTLGVAPLTDRPSCTDPAVYTTQAEALTGDTFRNGPRVGLPSAPGFYLLCAAAVTDEAPAVATAATAVFQVDATPPVRTPTLSVRTVDGGLQVAPVTSPPELVDYRVKVGPQASTDCAATAGYQAYRRVPLQLRSDQLPATVCVIGYDEAGNAGAPWSQLITS